MPLALPHTVARALLDNSRAQAGLSALKAYTEDRTVLGAWIGEDEQTIGEPFPIAVEGAYVEAFLPDGTIDAVLQPLPIALPDAPKDMAALLIHTPLTERIVLTRADLSVAALPHAKPESFPPGLSTPRISFPVFAERFFDRQRFLDHVQSLYDFIVRIPPFDREEVRRNFELRAYYWEGSPPNGWFDTKDAPYVCSSQATQVVTGNQDKARAMIGDLMLRIEGRGKFGLVLIDSPFRGGAGGMPDHDCPSWATITNCPGERWEAVALHEIAHAFGLADEYVLAERAREVWRHEPNVSVQADTRAVTARWPVNSPGDPTASLAQQIGQPLPEWQGAVGTFQGARYREDYYRPSYACMMKSATYLHFCRVCHDHLAGFFIEN